MYQTLTVTAYNGFSRVSGNLPLERFYSLIASCTYERHVEKIAWLISAGKTEEANNVKRQLPFFTATANYTPRRLPEHIVGYNDLITIDIDGLTDKQVVELRPLIERDPATIGNFLTIKQHGYKILAYLTGEQAETLRRTYLRCDSIAYEQLEEYHARIYELTRRHYETLLGIEVDTSGKDISRGIFASYDPQAFFSAERLEQVQRVTARIIPPPPAVKRKRKVAAKPQSTDEQPVHTNIDDISPITQMEFNKCVASTNRIVRYKEGFYNSFLFTLGNKCFQRGLNEEEVKRLAAHRYGDGGKWDTETPISNSYTYVDKTEKSESDHRQPTILRVKEFLTKNYIFRQNMVFERLEFKDLSLPPASQEFRTMSTNDLNTIFRRMSEANIKYSLNNLRAVVNSDFATPIEPIRAYFDSLPPWDGQTDYINELADTIQTTDQPYWREVFRRWLVGMVHCAINPDCSNQQALLIQGKQGRGKTTWIRNLLPPELKEYYRNGMINPSIGDNMMMLSTRILINMEEFEGVKANDVAELKRLISLENVVHRKIYELQSRTFIRRASFIGSTNNTQFLNDISGSRRFLVVNATEIDYRRKINYTGLYSQVLQLIRNGYQHWFEGEEIEQINLRNEQHRMKDPLEENLFVYFRPATPKDYMMKWKPAAAILSYLSALGRTQANAQSQHLLVQVLEREGFMKRVNDYGVTEYSVIVLNADEVENNAKQIKPVENPQ